MRNPNRLDDFYNELCSLHKEYLPDWRFGQLMSNFLIWLRLNHQNIDIYFPEEKEMIKLFKQFIASTVRCDLMCGGIDES